MTAIATPLPATRVDTGLLTDIKRFGAADIEACFSCGVCTATCPLVSDDGTFPRRMIRYAQLGLKDQLLSSRELWTCYACGQCSEQCPQQAEPGEFMAAARRWAVASYDRTKLAWGLGTDPVIGAVVAVLLAVALAAFMFAAHGPANATSLELFGFIPNELIHTLGLAIIAIVAVAGLLGVATMISGLRRATGVGIRGHTRAALGAAWTAVVVEALGQRRYRGECETDVRPWYRRRWFVHAATMWGFLGLFAATILDYGLELLGVKATGTVVPIWYPVRLLGTVAGVALLYGVSILIARRARAQERSLRHSTIGDWTFLVLLWLAGASGFILEIALYLPTAPVWGYGVFLFHVAIAMELVLLVPFTKFAHVIYRPVALFFLALATSPAVAAGEGSR
ncbi:MAG TPA: 4Fe-4S dicluster domain-containing protein [Candidatus Binatus sp.]|nr:4Fe-4S dicluster domain-containing protein [Candidatus Binatus sp.]